MAKEFSEYEIDRRITEMFQKMNTGIREKEYREKNHLAEVYGDLGGDWIIVDNMFSDEEKQQAVISFDESSNEVVIVPVDETYMRNKLPCLVVKGQDAEFLWETYNEAIDSLFKGMICLRTQQEIFDDTACSLIVTGARSDASVNTFHKMMIEWIRTAYGKVSISTSMKIAQGLTKEQREGMFAELISGQKDSFERVFRTDVVSDNTWDMLDLLTALFSRHSVCCSDLKDIYEACGVMVKAGVSKAEDMLEKYLEETDKKTQEMLAIIMQLYVAVVGANDAYMISKLYEYFDKITSR